MVKKMSKKVVILHGSPRVSGNSDILAKEFKKGAEDAGNEVKKISFPMRFINYCKGCLGCVSSGECVIHDDMSGILEDMADADIIVFASPIYFNTISGQMKTMLNRMFSKFQTCRNRIWRRCRCCWRNTGQSGIKRGLWDGKKV